MNKQSSFPMSNTVALALLKELITPGNPPLGIPFGWEQPKPNSYINFENIYCTPDDFYVDEKINFEKLTEEQKEILNKYKIDENSHITPTGIWSTTKSVKYCDLCREELYLYRLAILVLNTMTEYHNWSVEYIEYLGETYASKYSKNLEYEYDGNKFDEFLQEAIDNDIILPENLYLNILDTDNPCYSYSKNIDITWLEKYDNEKDVLCFLFPDVVKTAGTYTCEDDVFPFIVWICEWLKELWNSGEIKITDPEQLKNKELQNFAIMVNAQLVFTFLDGE